MTQRRTTLWWIGGLIVFFMPSCIKYNLELRELITFSLTLYSSKTLGVHTYLPAIQAEDSRYWVGGVDEFQEGIISIYSEKGMLERQYSNLVPGEISVLQRLEGTDDKFLVVSVTRGNSFFSVINQTGVLETTDSIKHLANMIIGSVEDIHVTGCILSQDKTGWLITGRLKQTIGNPRMLLAKLTPDLEFEWMRTYQKNVTGFQLAQTEDGNIVQAAMDNNRQTIIGLFNNLGISQWFKMMPNAQLPISVFPSLVVENDTIWTASTRQDEIASDIVLFTYDIEGNSIRENTYGSPIASESGASISSVRNGGLLLQGTIDTTNYLLSMIERRTGLLLWEELFEGKNGTIFPRVCRQANDFGMFGLWLQKQDSDVDTYQLIKTDEEGQTEQL